MAAAVAVVDHQRMERVPRLLKGQTAAQAQVAADRVAALVQTADQVVAQG
jgi:hypothetical protein